MKVVFGPTGGDKSNFYPFFVWDFLTKFNKSVVVKFEDGILQRSFLYSAPDADSKSGYDKNRTVTMNPNLPEVF